MQKWTKYTRGLIIISAFNNIVAKIFTVFKRAQLKKATVLINQNIPNSQTGRIITDWINSPAPQLQTDLKLQFHTNIILSFHILLNVCFIKEISHYPILKYCKFYQTVVYFSMCQANLSLITNVNVFLKHNTMKLLATNFFNAFTLCHQCTF